MTYNNFIDRLFQDSNHSIIHGMAGTGKSTLINSISDRIGERCLKLAPTGLAAYNINGTTIDSLLLCYHNAKDNTLTRLAQYDSIIIDEISMVHCFKMDMIFEIIESLQNRGKTVKLVLIGDPFQLPPVTTQNMTQAYSKKMNTALTPEKFYFFHSGYFQNYFNAMDCFLLVKNYRQGEAVFKNILEKIANGTANKRDLCFINQQFKQPFQNLSFQDVPVITPHRSGANLFNQIGMERFEPKYFHDAVFEKRSIDYSDIEQDCRNITEPIVYATGVPVVFTQNDCKNNWVNGTRGDITFCGSGYYNTPIVKILRKDRNNEIYCEPTRHELYRFVYRGSTGKVDNECVAIVRQFPFVLGFALTVHKTQGMTLDKMAFNPGEGCFAPGQLYVALSRVKNINDLTLHVPIEPSDILVSSDVQIYFDNFMRKCESVQ